MSAGQCEHCGIADAITECTRLGRNYRRVVRYRDHDLHISRSVASGSISETVQDRRSI